MDEAGPWRWCSDDGVSSPDLLSGSFTVIASWLPGKQLVSITPFCHEALLNTGCKNGTGQPWKEALELTVSQSEPFLFNVDFSQVFCHSDGKLTQGCKAKDHQAQCCGIWGFKEDSGGMYLGSRKSMKKFPPVFLFQKLKLKKMNKPY